MNEVMNTQVKYRLAVPGDLEAHERHADVFRLALNASRRPDDRRKARRSFRSGPCKLRAGGIDAKKMARRSGPF
ncbi:MAG: hypothetical protein FP825_05710 [Hyphomonas sp.]|uniref:hypothetical protein n=1 Tax=Hyphomonas sp. TaxID=87 RepID=UPI0017A4CBCA|nr:hypothetical protein [Hyphomonas sp.]MBA3067963.1 hypothetical protein [Hyphomonas sp.]MBU3919372.1 hypothetical protein [Alphaproteobacteria bacterium]MBU4061301.1 hypothetical protein [Alphaproteobacteria bacterium]MBU4162554.1 hypothetical protein [Alphaproteobacteria bacterium]